MRFSYSIVVAHQAQIISSSLCSNARHYTVRYIVPQSLYTCIYKYSGELHVGSRECCIRLKKTLLVTEPRDQMYMYSWCVGLYSFIYWLLWVYTFASLSHLHIIHTH